MLFLFYKVCILWKNNDKNAADMYLMIYFFSEKSEAAGGLFIRLWV